MKMMIRPLLLNDLPFIVSFLGFFKFILVDLGDSLKAYFSDDEDFCGFNENLKEKRTKGANIFISGSENLMK
jgi:hypothetical protein